MMMKPYDGTGCIPGGDDDDDVVISINWATKKIATVASIKIILLFDEQETFWIAISKISSIPIAYNELSIKIWELSHKIN